MAFPAAASGGVEDDERSDETLVEVSTWEARPRRHVAGVPWSTHWSCDECSGELQPGRRRSDGLHRGGMAAELHRGLPRHGDAPWTRPPDDRDPRSHDAGGDGSGRSEVAGHRRVRAADGYQDGTRP